MINPTEAASAHSPTVDRTGVLCFLGLAFALSWGAWLGLRAAHVPFPIRVAVGMFGPAVACWLLRGPLRHEGFADAGLQFTTAGRRIGWAYLAAYLSVPLLIFTGIGLALLTGTQHWALGQNVHIVGRSIADALAKSGTPTPPLSPLTLAVTTLVSEVALAFTLGLPFNMIFTFGEELGWRGYLLPRLAPLGEAQAAVIVGIVWGLWHAPVIVLDGFNYPGYPWMGVGMMVAFTIPTSVIFAWLRLRSGSIWPSALAHAALNAQAGFGLLLLSRGNSLLRPPQGVIGIVPLIVFALWLIWTGRLERSPQRPS